MNSSLVTGWIYRDIGDLIDESRIELEQDDPAKRLSVKLNLGGVEKRSERDNDQIGNTKYFLRRSGQFIYGKQNLHKGAIGLIPENLDGFSSSQDLPAFDVNHSVSKDWLLHYFSQQHFYQSLERIATGTGSKRIQPNELYKEQILVPPLKEQQKIAEILTLVDEVIVSTQSQISKLEDLKKATMNELLTRGIGHTEFKETEIGRIPKSWKETTLENFCARVTDGTHDTPKQVKNGYYLLTSKNLTGDSLNFTGAYQISTEDFDEVNKRSRVDEFDVLFGMIGTIGNPTIVYERDLPIAVKNVGILKVNRDLTTASFLCAYLTQERVLRKINLDQTGNAQKFIGLGYLRQFPIATPSPEEIKQISEIFRHYERTIRTVTKKLNALNQLKTSLMQDLLTGKVRVTVN